MNRTADKLVRNGTNPAALDLESGNGIESSIHNGTSIGTAEGIT
jgi:hypothetical protein